MGLVFITVLFVFCNICGTALADSEITIQESESDNSSNSSISQYHAQVVYPYEEFSTWKSSSAPNGLWLGNDLTDFTVKVYAYSVTGVEFVPEDSYKVCDGFYTCDNPYVRDPVYKKLDDEPSEAGTYYVRVEGTGVYSGVTYAEIELNDPGDITSYVHGKGGSVNIKDIGDNTFVVGYYDGNNVYRTLVPGVDYTVEIWYKWVDGTHSFLKASYGSVKAGDVYAYKISGCGSISGTTYYEVGVYDDKECKNGHSLTHYEAKQATDAMIGNAEYWHCRECGKFFADKNARVAVKHASLIIPMPGTEEAGTGADYFTVVGDAVITKAQNKSAVTSAKKMIAGKTFSIKAKGSKNIKLDASSSGAKTTMQLVSGSKYAKVSNNKITLKPAAKKGKSYTIKVKVKSGTYTSSAVSFKVKVK